LCKWKLCLNPRNTEVKALYTLYALANESRIFAFNHTGDLLYWSNQFAHCTLGRLARRLQDITASGVSFSIHEPINSSQTQGYCLNTPGNCLFPRNGDSRILDSRTQIHNWPWQRLSRAAVSLALQSPTCTAMTMIHQNQVQYDRSHWMLEGLLIASPGAGTLSSSEQFFT
jgi:hypothetical protein